MARLVRGSLLLSGAVASPAGEAASGVKIELAKD